MPTAGPGRLAAEHEKTNVVFYKSRKLVVQGKGTQEFVEFVLEPEILKEARLGYETVLNPEPLLPRLGVDESGKGDFFGPLCIPGAYVNETVVKVWKDSGTRDSMHVSTNRQIQELAELIRQPSRGGLERQFGMALPKGASAAVDAAAREFVAQHGADALPKVAKMHFRTAMRAQGLPEPPKVEWRRRP